MYSPWECYGKPLLIYWSGKRTVLASCGWDKRGVSHRDTVVLWICKGLTAAASPNDVTSELVLFFGFFFLLVYAYSVSDMVETLDRVW